MPLTTSPLVAFVPTVDTPRAREFYCGTLGLRLVEETPFALVLDAARTTLRVTPVAELKPASYTVLGWTVDGITATVRELAGRGVQMLRYPGMQQDSDGVWRAPSGARVVWFCDPDGNTLSLTQLERSSTGDT